jgi:hypothetical protein
MDNEETIFIKDNSKDLRIKGGQKELKTVEKKQEIVPKEYIKIKLDSLGKLNAPAILHVRNYNMDNALELSLADDDTALESTILVLREMIWEDFDPLDLHLSELKQILLTIYSNFWGSIIQKYPYPYEEYELVGLSEQEKNDIRTQKKPVTIDIPINKIKTFPITKEFKEPIKITMDDNTIYFKLSRVRDIIESQEYIEKKYLPEERKYSDIEFLLKSEDADKVSQKQKDDYLAYTKKRAYDLVKTIQSQVLVKINDQELKTLKEKVEQYPAIDIRFWKAYNQVVEKYGGFGIIDEIKVESPLTNEIVTRRFQFRYVDFLRSLDVQDDSGYDVEFGD